MYRTNQAEGLQNQHCSEEAGVHRQKSQPQEVLDFRGEYVCDPQGDQGDLLYGDQDLPLSALL